MALEIEFAPLSVEELPALAAEKKAEGARFVQLLAVNTEEGIDLIYTFMKGGVLTNHEIKGVGPDMTVPASPTSSWRRSYSRTRRTTCSA